MITELLFIVCNWDTKRLLQKFFPQVRKWALNHSFVMKEGMGELLLHLKFMVYFIVSLVESFIFLHWLVTTLRLAVGIQKCYAPAPARTTTTRLKVLHKTSFAFIVITHWCERKTKNNKCCFNKDFFTVGVDIKVFGLFCFQIIFTGITEHFIAVCYRSTQKCFESFIYYT